MRTNLSISQRVMISFAVMTALVVTASGIGFLFVNTVLQSTNAARGGIDQVERVADLAFVWSEVAATLDNMLLTRQISLIEEGLDDEIEAFNQQVAAMRTRPLGQSPETIAENQRIAEELYLLGVELNRIVNELTTLAQQQRWARAQALRHTELVSFQRRFDDRLAELNNNTREEVDQLLVQAMDAQQTSQRLWLATILVAIIFAGMFSVVAIRGITRPIRKLTDQTKRIARRDFSPIVPLTQRDEIGELSQTVALMTDWLRESYQSLEQRVAERTRRLEMVATVSERINILLGVDEVLNEVIKQIEQNFNFYHAHIYVLDAAEQRLVVSAGTGEAGTTMKARRHSIALDSTGLVARAARTGQAVWVDDVTTTTDWLPNPMLPESRSELAVPISVDNQVVGVLDVQSSQPRGFDDSDANVLRYLASQVAVAIRNARLFEQVEAALSKAEAAYQRYIEQSWQKTKIVQRHGQSLYLHAGSSLTENTENVKQTLQEARQQVTDDNQPTVVSLPAEGQANNVLVVPVNLRNNKIGLAQLSAKKAWTDDDLAVVQAVLDQLAQTADNMRLFEETRERASRERLVSQIGDKLRRAPDFETLMKVGVEELARALKPGRTFVKMGSEAELQREASPAGAPEPGTYAPPESADRSPNGGGNG